MRSGLSSSRLSGTTFAQLFLYFAKSNSSLTLVDLIFLLILSIHVTLILSYPYTFTIHSHMFLIFLSNVLVIIMTSKQDRGGSYLLVQRRTIFLGQFEGNLGTDQLIGQYLNLFLDRHESTWDRNRNRYLILLNL